MNGVKKHFDRVARDYDYYKNKNKFYYSNLKILLSSLIPKKSNILEVGCGTGDLIMSLNPALGVGFDLSSQMVRIADKKHQHKAIIFTTKLPNKKFDYIFMSDVIEHLEDPKKTFDEISKLMHKNCIFVNTMANPIWEPILMIAEKFGLKMPEGPHKRIRYNDIEFMANRSGLKIIEHNYFLLMPIYIPLISNFINKHLERYFKKYAFIEYFVAKKK